MPAKLMLQPALTHRAFALLVSSVLAVACGAAKQTERPARPESATSAVQPPSQFASGLYAPDEALRDALSGPLEYLGTGPWPGIERIQACAFRNQRVLVVNVYCTLTDTQAFRVDVYSPARGHVRIYAESKGFLSAHSRRDYFTFMAETEPPPGPQTGMPRLLLTMSLDEVRAYEERRYRSNLPACYGGQELSRQRGACMGSLAPLSPEWANRSRAFLEQANDDWYRAVREMRALALRYGREPE